MCSQTNRNTFLMKIQLNIGRTEVKHTNHLLCCLITERKENKVEWEQLNWNKTENEWRKINGVFIWFLYLSNRFQTVAFAVKNRLLKMMYRIKCFFFSRFNRMGNKIFRYFDRKITSNRSSFSIWSRGSDSINENVNLSDKRMK